MVDAIVLDGLLEDISLARVGVRAIRDNIVTDPNCHIDLRALDGFQLSSVSKLDDNGAGEGMKLTTRAVWLQSAP
jgi:hypothetical protein